MGRSSGGWFAGRNVAGEKGWGCGWYSWDVDVWEGMVERWVLLVEVGLGEEDCTRMVGGCDRHVGGVGGG